MLETIGRLARVGGLALVVVAFAVPRAAAAQSLSWRAVPPDTVKTYYSSYAYRVESWTDYGPVCDDNGYETRCYMSDTRNDIDGNSVQATLNGRSLFTGIGDLAYSCTTYWVEVTPGAYDQASHCSSVYDGAFDAGGQTPLATNTVQLTGYSPGQGYWVTISDSYYVPVVHKVAVTPKDPTQIIVDSGTTYSSAVVKNLGNQTETYAIGAVCSGEASACATIQWVSCGSGQYCIAPLSSVTLAPNAEQQVAMSFTALVRGAPGTVRPFARYDAATADTGFYNIKVRDKHYVTVTPVASSISALPGGQYEARFNVRYVDSVSQKLLITPYCSGSATYGACVALVDTITAASGVSTQVSVVFTGNRTVGDTGTVQLNAAMDIRYPEPSVIGIGRSPVTVTTPAPPPVLSLDSVNTGDVLERDLCVTINLGPGAASECGDLRLVHELPSIRTMNKSRTPTLIYNSQHAHPIPIVAALVTPPAGSALPSSVELQILLNGQARTLIGGAGANNSVVSWPGSQWGSGGQSRRIAAAFDANDLVTGIYSVTVQVTLVTGTTRTPYSSSLALPIVNRNKSPFGAGWWLAGVESYDSTSKMWTGGDGSVRRYTRDASTPTNKWVASAVDHPDTIALVNGSFVRYAPDSVRVYFDLAGRHVKTVNRLGHVTQFGYDATGRPTRIFVPTPGNGGGPRDPNDSTAMTTAAPQRWYRITFVAAATYRDSVRIEQMRGDSSAPTVLRTTRLVKDSAANRLKTVVDPDGYSVGFAYLSGGLDSNRVSRRIDRRGTASTYGYDNGRRVTSVDRGLQPTVSQTRITAAESRSVPGTSFPQAQPVSSYATKIDGPRDDVGDTTEIWINRFGAPVKNKDAANAITTIEYADGRWPGLATRIQYHGGRALAAVYDSRGHILVTVDKPRNAINRYRWHPLYDRVTMATSPTGLFTLYEYTAGAKRFWEMPAADGSRRTSYQYYANGLPRLTELPGIPEVQNTSVVRSLYDNLGNLATIISPKGVVTKFQADSLGRTVVTKQQIDSAATPKFAEDSIDYDASDQVVRSTQYGPGMNGIAAQRVTVLQYYNAEGQRDSVVRQELPDTTIVGRLKSSWRYDALGRPWLSLVVDTGATSAGDTTTFDAAGNVVRVGTRRGGELTMVYDSLNRLAKRRTSAVTYRSTDAGIPHIAGKSAVEWGPYPRYWNDNTSHGISIPKDSAIYNYDQSGNLIRALNRDADVRRGYDTTGFLIADTLIIRTVKEVGAGGDMTAKHRYVLRYTYDLEGRRTFVQHPDQLGPYAGAGTTFTYEAKFGQPQYVSDALGATYRYHFNARGDPDSLYMPRGWTESFQYDADGNRIKHLVRDPTGALFRNERTSYDARGNALFIGDSSGVRDTIVAAFTGLGQLQRSTQAVGTQDMYGKAGHHTSTQEFVPDAMSNAVITNDTQDDVVYGESSGSDRWSRQQRFQRGVGRHTATGVRWLNEVGRDRTDTLVYDASGNAVWASQSLAESHAAMEDRASYYDAADKLYAADYRTVPDLAMIQTSASYVEYHATFEEYRYDALGRRVWTRARRYCEKSGELKVECNISTVRRTVWDGNAELYEIQMPGDEGMIDDTLENDTAPVKRQNDPLYTATDPSAFFGRVAYAYGLALDRPLSIIRLAYTDSRGYTYAPFTIVPLWNGRGQAYNGYFAQSGGQLCVDQSAGRCVRVGYPNHWNALGQTRISRTFNGTLIEDKQDKAGTLYRRNRTYDPGSGRFTQEDPLGLAGGVNFYGYADGNPLTYSDPFGLCNLRDWRTCNIFSFMGGVSAPSTGVEIKIFGATIKLGASLGSATVTKKLTYGGWTKTTTDVKGPGAEGSVSASSGPFGAKAGCKVSASGGSCSASVSESAKAGKDGKEVTADVSTGSTTEISIKGKFGLANGGVSVDPVESLVGFVGLVANTAAFYKDYKNITQGGFTLRIPTGKDGPGTPP